MKEYPAEVLRFINIGYYFAQAYEKHTLMRANQRACHQVYC